MQPPSTRATASPNSGPNLGPKFGNVSFGFGWWYYAQTEGATALA